MIHCGLMVSWAPKAIEGHNTNTRDSSSMQSLQPAQTMQPVYGIDQESDKITVIQHIRNLITIQRFAMKANTECYRTIPMIAMEIEAGLQSVWIRLQTKVLQSIMLTQSLTTEHSI